MSDTLVPATVIEDMLLDTLKAWIEWGLGAVERATGRDENSIRSPRSWGTPQGDYVKRPEQHMPAIGILSPGTEGTPERDGETYSATWRFEVRCVVSARDAKATDRLSKAYAAAIAKVVIQKLDGEPIQDVRWMGDRYDVLAGDSDRTMIGVAVNFDVTATEVLSQRGGPDEPPDDRSEPPDGPVVETVHYVGVRTPIAD